MDHDLHSTTHRPTPAEEPAALRPGEPPEVRELNAAFSGKLDGLDRREHGGTLGRNGTPEAADSN